MIYFIVWDYVGVAGGGGATIVEAIGGLANYRGA